MRELHELPGTEMVKSGTIRLTMLDQMTSLLTPQFSIKEEQEENMHLNPHHVHVFPQHCYLTSPSSPHHISPPSPIHTHLTYLTPPPYPSSSLPHSSPILPNLSSFLLPLAPPHLITASSPFLPPHTTYTYHPSSLIPRPTWPHPSSLNPHPSPFLPNSQ